MKKLCVGVAALLLLVGCGSSTKTEVKTCTISQNGMDMVMSAEAKDKKIVKNTIEIKIPKSIFEAGGQNFDNLSEEQLNELGKQQMAAQGYTEGKGITISVKKSDDALTIKAVTDAEKMDEETLTATKMDVNTSLDDFTKQMTTAGFTCK